MTDLNMQTYILNRMKELELENNKLKNEKIEELELENERLRKENRKLNHKLKKYMNNVDKSPLYLPDTPLYWASRSGYEKVVRLLLDVDEKRNGSLPANVRVKTEPGTCIDLTGDMEEVHDIHPDSNSSIKVIEIPMYSSMNDEEDEEAGIKVSVENDEIAESNAYSIYEEEVVEEEEVEEDEEEVVEEDEEEVVEEEEEVVEEEEEVVEEDEVEEEEEEEEDEVDEDEEELEEDEEDEEVVEEEVVEEDEEEEEVEEEVVEEEELELEEEEEVVEEEEEEEVVEEEEVEEEEEEEEVISVTIKGKTYYAYNQVDSVIYAEDENGDISVEVGKYVKGKPVFKK